MESENDLTRCEVVLHEINKAAIDAFLQAHGFGTVGESWERKIKLVLLVIDEVQLGIRKYEGA